MASASLPKWSESTPETQALAIHPVWNLETVYIQVNETLFLVPKNVLLGSSTNSPFEVVFSALPTDKENVEGSSPKNPIKLEQIAEADFDNFLRVLYPLPKVSLPTSYVDWLGVLRLSHMWHYDSIRRRAIAEITPKFSSSASHKINLGGQYLVQEWVREGYAQLIRDLMLQPHHLAKKPLELSWEIIAKVFHAKYLCLQAMLNDPGRTCNCGSSDVFQRISLREQGKLRTHVCQCNALSVVDEVFREEIALAKFNSE